MRPAIDSASLAQKASGGVRINGSRLAHLLTSEPRQTSICKVVDFTVIEDDRKR